MSGLSKEFWDAHEQKKASTNRPMDCRTMSAEIRMQHLRKWATEFRTYCKKKERNSTWLEDVEFLLKEIDRLEKSK